jgi:hypothetical protein
MQRKIDGEDSDEEQKPGEFTPRPADSPQIGQKLGHVPTLDELHAKALTADPVVKPKRAKAKAQPAGARNECRTDVNYRRLAQKGKHGTHPRVPGPQQGAKRRAGSRSGKPGIPGPHPEQEPVEF